MGNDMADQLAVEGAQRLEVPCDVAQGIVDRVAELRRIQLRLVAIMCSTDHRRRQLVCKEVMAKRPTFRESLEATRHAFEEIGGRFKCVMCQITVSSKTKLKVIPSTCEPRTSHLQSQLRVKGQMMFRARLTHHTHVLHLYRGVACCVVCGGLASDHLGLLGLLCRGSATGHGRRTIRQFSKRILPHGLSRWPVQESFLHDLEQKHCIDRLNKSLVLLRKAQIDLEEQLAQSEREPEKDSSVGSGDEGSGELPDSQASGSSSSD